MSTKMIGEKTFICLQSAYKLSKKYEHGNNIENEMNRAVFAYMGREIERESERERVTQIRS